MVADGTGFEIFALHSILQEANMLDALAIITVVVYIIVDILDHLPQLPPYENRVPFVFQGLP